MNLMWSKEQQEIDFRLGILKSSFEIKYEHENAYAHFKFKKQ